MKWYHSIITRISLIFALSLFGILAIFFSINHHEKDKNLRTTFEHSQLAIRSAIEMPSRKIDFSKLEEMGFVLIKDEKLKKAILKEPRNIMQVPMKRMGERFGFKLDCVGYEGYIYTLLLEKDGNTVVLKSPYEREYLFSIIFPLLVIGFVIFLYIGIIRSLLPLKNLRNEIKKFANGDYELACRSEKKDEIAALANEFDSAVTKIKSLRDSRQLFLRNIMHELKTPITKGKLASEMIEDATYATILQNVFRRQEALLEEFSRIEKLSADELKLEIKEYHIEDLVDFALDILDDKQEMITCKIKPIRLHVDFELFGVVIKNLLDNGINYSRDHKVYLENDEKSITISNVGEPLEFPLERYSEPYFLEGKKQKSSRGLGFGLFISFHVVRLHGMRLEYQRLEDKNIFKILLKPSSI